MNFPARSGADTPGNAMVNADLGAPPRGDGCAVRLVAFAPSYRASAPTPLTLTLERDDFSSNRHPALSFCLSMIFSENRYPLFRIML